MALLLLTMFFGQVPPFSARFEQVTAESSRVDTTRGTIYFAAPWRVYYEVDYPLKQLVSAVMGELTICYPDESLAYVIKAPSQLESPMSQQSMGMGDPARAISEIGLKPGKRRMAGDTVYAVWNPRDRRAPLGRVTFGRVGRATVFVEVTRRDGRPMVRSRMSAHIQVDTFELPTRISTERFGAEGTRTLETFTYTDLDTSIDFLKVVGRFSIPPHVKTETYK
jgi:hypothetical protein